MNVFVFQYGLSKISSVIYVLLTIYIDFVTLLFRSLFSSFWNISFIKSYLYFHNIYRNIIFILVRTYRTYILVHKLQDTC